MISYQLSSEDVGFILSSPSWLSECSPFIVFITSPSTVYIGTCIKSPYYSQNDEHVARSQTKNVEENLKPVKKKIAETIDYRCWLNIRTILLDGYEEIQDLIAFIGNLF